MATAPMKSQHPPLHNFSLPFLKWGQRNILTTSDNPQCTDNPQCRRLSTASTPPSRRQSDSDSDSGNSSDPENPPPPRSPWPIAKMEKESVSERNGHEVGEAEEGGEVARAWNLRPRRGACEAAAAVPGNGGGTTKSGRLRGGGGTERRENMRLWVSLSKEEIEEDVYSFTGSRPSRRPKKRPKSIQKNLDNLFPGLCMVGFTADTYRVHDFLK